RFTKAVSNLIARNVWLVRILADNVCHPAIAGAYQNNSVILFHEKQVGTCLRHLSYSFCRQRVKLDSLRHNVTNCFGRIRWSLRQMQIFQIFFDDEALLLREIDSSWDWRDGRFLLLLRQNWVARRKVED